MSSFIQYNLIRISFTLNETMQPYIFQRKKVFAGKITSAILQHAKNTNYNTYAAPGVTVLASGVVRGRDIV